jgi:creatinine amidohydrolase
MMYESIGKKDGAWAGMTAGRIQDVGDREGSVFVVPVGSTEQHGNHLPVITDTVLVEAVVDAAIQKLDDLPVVVTPPVWFGFSPHHLSFGGTLSADFATLRSMLENVARTGLRNGFDAVIFVNGHGGNGPLINTVVSTVGTTTQAEVLGTTYFELATGETEDLRNSPPGGMAHGGEFETSLMLAVRPDLVADHSARDGTPMDERYEWSGQDLLDEGPVAVYRPFDTYSDSGAIGAPKEATTETGKRILSAISEELAALFVAIHTSNSE